MISSIPKKVTGTSPASASTAAGNTVNDMGAFDTVKVIAELQGATGGTLDVYLQGSWDGGTTWYDVVHFPQLAAGASAVVYTTTLALDSNIYTVGKNMTPALAANSVAGGHWGDKVRALYVAGASTSAGAPVAIYFYGTNARR